MFNKGKNWLQSSTCSQSHLFLVEGEYEDAVLLKDRRGSKYLALMDEQEIMYTSDRELKETYMMMQAITTLGRREE